MNNKAQQYGHTPAGRTNMQDTALNNEALEFLPGTPAYQGLMEMADYSFATGAISASEFMVLKDKNSQLLASVGTDETVLAADV